MEKANLVKKLWALLWCSCILFSAKAATIKARIDGDWENPSSWVQGVVPTNGDSIVISNGKTITVTTQLNYSGGAPMKLNISGSLDFQTGKKLTLPLGSIIVLQIDGDINPGNGNGNSNTITIGTNQVWNAGMGTISGYLVLPYTPLPIQMLNFKAVTQATSIIISWQTVTELNSDYMELQRSDDGFTFEVIATFDGHGTTNNYHNYSFTDASPLRNENYYRIRQVDFDNKFKYSNTIHCLYKSEAKDGVQLFPNPSDGAFFVSLPSNPTNGTVEITVTDTRANVLLRKRIQDIPGSKGLQVTSYETALRPGMYFVTVSINDETYRNQMVVY